MSRIWDNEAALANELILWLTKEGWVVHQEVQLTGSGRTVDIVAEKDNKLWAIECKNTFTESVLDQCYLHTPNFHYISCAVPGYRRSYRYSSSQKETSFVKEHFLRCHGIGLIRVGERQRKNSLNVHEEIKPEYQRMFKKNTTMKLFLTRIKKIRAKFHELHQTATAGATGGQVTDYKVSMYNLREYLKDHDLVDPLAVAKIVEHHYRKPHLFKAAILRGIDNGWIPGVVKEIVGRKAHIKFLKEEYNTDGSPINP